MRPTAITRVHGRQILDSRGRPTVEVDVELADGSLGRAAVPSGASTGAAEAHELRDGGAAYGGRGVRRAVANVDGELAAAVRDHDALDQRGLDDRLRAVDGTPALSRLGANAILGISLAACRAAAMACRQPLHTRVADLAGTTAVTLPLPMVNILSGGLHAEHGMDVQDYLAVPVGAESIAEALEMIADVRASATELSRERGLPTLLADEGGLSPGFASARAALEFMVAAIERAGRRPGDDIAIAIDVAASELLAADGTYRFAREGRSYGAEALIDAIDEWVRDYPVISIEDALGEEDWASWRSLTARLADRVQLVGDDLFATNAGRLQRGIDHGVANAVLVKLNQNGTLTGTLDTMALARARGYATVVSARSGETEDSFIADLAVGTAAGQIKIGSLRCSDRLAKYNQLLRIEEATGACFAGRAAISRRQ